MTLKLSPPLRRGCTRVSTRA